MIPFRIISLALVIVLPTLSVSTQALPQITGEPATALTLPDAAMISDENKASRDLLANPDPSALVGLPELPDFISPFLPAIEGRGVDDNLLPLRLPGYELRVLDKRKKLLYNIKGSWVEASLPVYFYYPTEPAHKEKALQLLHKVYDNVLALGEKPQWTASEFRNVLVSLDAALSLLEAGNAENKAASSPRP